MKLPKRLFAIALAAGMSVTVFGMTTSALTVRIKHGSLSLSEGRNYDLGRYLEITYDQNDDRSLDESDVKWSSSNNRAATVYGDGTIHASGGGRAIISASLSGRDSNEISVIVHDRSDDGEDWDDGDDFHNFYNDRPGSSGNATLDLLNEIKYDRSPSLIKAADQAAVVSAVSQSASARLDNYASVSVDVLKAAAKVRDSAINFDTRSGGELIGRLQLTPSRAASLSSEAIKLGVHYMDNKTETLQKLFNDTYDNPVHVVVCDAGSFGMTVRPYVRLEADGLTAEDLAFHTYAAASNAVSELAVSGVTVDENGYVSFNTSTGGTILISEGTLR